eukprot:COSAG04_NODE_566_length_12556_cov_6.540018_3_plen_372_part_00
MPAKRPRLSVTVPYASASGDEGHTVYSIDVSEASYALAWTVARRFSEFDFLRQQLDQESDAAPLTSAFPPKRWFWNMDPEVVEERRTQLEAWLREAFVNAAAETAPLLLEFVDAPAQLERAEAERQAAALRAKWAKRKVPAARGAATTQLHTHASTGQTARLLHTLREARGENDWLQQSPAVFEPNPVSAAPRRPELEPEAEPALDMTLGLPAERLDGRQPEPEPDRRLLAAIDQISSGGRAGTAGSAASSAALGTLDGGDPSGRTAFHLACAAGHRECVRALVQAGCRTELVDAEGRTGWEWALAPLRQREVLDELSDLAQEGAEEEGTAQRRRLLRMEAQVMALDAAAGGGGRRRKKRGRGRAVSSSTI